MTPRKGAIEYERLWNCHEWLARDGWDRRRGDATVTMLRRGTERRYLVLHGHHRAAAATAVGLDHVPARPGTPPFVDADDVDYWPQVRRGVWTREAARRYIDHLFDFEPAAWAARRGLLRRAPSEAGTNHASW